MQIARIVGLAAGVLGLLLCMISVALRLGGAYLVGGFQVGTLMQAGIAGMVAGCFCLLAVLIFRKT